MKTVTVHHPLMDQVVELVETYRGFNIVKDGECLMVHDPRNETLFVLGLDDSKSSGRRIFDEKYNTVEEGRRYIDHTINSRTSPLAKKLQEVNPTMFQDFKAYLAKAYPDWKNHPTEKDIATMRWFCHQTEQEQLGYLISFLDQRHNNSLFAELRENVINEFRHG